MEKEKGKTINIEENAQHLEIRSYWADFLIEAAAKALSKEAGKLCNIVCRDFSDDDIICNLVAIHRQTTVTLEALEKLLAEAKS